MYSYDAEDEEESFTIHFLYEEVWETDTSEKIKQKQVCYFVLVMFCSNIILVAYFVQML